MEFCASIRLEATEGQIANIERAFSEGSGVLADATDGQFRFGRVDIVNNSGASRQAEVWILPGTGGAYAPEGEYGKPGEHIVFFYDQNYV